jgi:hexosaminidase
MILAAVCGGAISGLMAGCDSASAQGVDKQAEAFPPAGTLNVIPAPASVSRRAGYFALGQSTPILAQSGAESSRVARYFADLMRESTSLELRVFNHTRTGSGERAVVFRLQDGGAAGQSPEAYVIDADSTRVLVSAADPRGLLYGAVTLWQLATQDGVPKRMGSGVELPAVRIVDHPRFGWRGLMLDSARHYQSPEFILQFIDWMALHKLNVLHWHLTDDQAWRLEIKKYPRLTSVGAWRVPAGAAAAQDIDPTTGKPRLYGGYYSQETVRRIVAHAAERNVTVVPELDMPGHATAAIVAYPQLASTDHPPQAVPSDWGIYRNLYNVDEPTFAFLQDVLDEVMGLFPGEYIHAGGDEAVKDQWKASPKVQARMRELGIADEQKLQSYFVQRIGRYLHAHGRRLIGWDEILDGGIAPSATVMSWRGVEGAVAAAAAGHDTVLAPQPTLYFDHIQALGPELHPGRLGVVTLEDVYRFDPEPAIAADQRQHILGLQANVWTEHVRTDEAVGYVTFPRAAAVAETGWSPRGGPTWESFRARIPAEIARYRALRIPHSEDDVTAGAPAPPVPGPFEPHHSQDLQTCSNALTLSLEDDAPLHGARAVFMIDIMNPCWIFQAADLSRAPDLRAAVGQLPFNFQIGDDVKKIVFDPPRTPSGELEVRLDGCQGEVIASIPLAPALASDAVTVLPDTRLPVQPGRHALCLKFTQRTIDPLWAIDWVQLLE